MNQIFIQYDTYYDKWTEEIKICLDENDIIYKKDTPEIICRSLQYQVEKYLKDCLYKPKEKFVWRKDFASKLRHEGMKLEIKSNDILWLYLKHFTDIDDYTKCFDVRLIIDDWDKATKNVFVVNVNNTPQFNIHTNIPEYEYTELSTVVDKYKQLTKREKGYPYIAEMNAILGYLLGYIIDKEVNNEER